MSSSTKSNFGLKAALSFSVGLTALAAGVAPIAMAQDDADEGARRLSTVTITATKREQTLQDVPVAVSVVDNTTIEKAEIQDLNDLQSVVPSLRVGQLQSSANTNFIIRGFGNGANNVGIEPSVGVFVDGVYRSRSAAQISDLPNLQRVEVLRGPQSTLFGKNASAGVISIVTRKPQFETQGSIEATAGNFNAFRMKGDLTGPLSDTVAYSLAGNINTRDGYADDIATGEETNERNRWGVRGELLFTPSETLELRLIGDYDKIDEVCCVAGNLVNGPTGGLIQLIGGNINGEDPFSYEVFGNFPSENEIENSGLSLQVDKEFSGFDVTSITAFRKVDSFTNQDSDFTSADLIGLNENSGKIDTFTQELRFTSNNPDSSFDWMVGGFYFDESVEVSSDFEYGADYRNYADGLLVGLGAPGALAGVETALGLPVGATFGQNGQGPEAEFGQDNKAWSVFGTLDFYLTDRLTATVGLNYTEDEKDAFYRQTNSDVFSAVDLVQLGFGSALAGAGVDPTDPTAVGAFALANPAAFAAIQAAAADPAQNPLLGLQALQFLPPFLDFPNSVEDGSSSDNATTHTLRVAYDLTDNINVYGSWATGFKATSWNLSRDSRPFASDFIAGSSVTSPPSSPIRDAGLAVPNLTSGTRFAGPEDSEVFEIGVKGAFSTFAFNLAIFDQTIEGFQSNAFTGTGFALANAGEQSTTGAEFDLTWSATEALTLNFAGTFLDPVYDSFVGSASGDLSGQTPSGIPDVATSMGFNYDFALGNWDSYVRADWQYSADTDFFDDPGNQALIDSVGYSREVNEVNAATGFENDNGVSVAIWARNLLDEQRITTAFPSVAQAGSISGYPSQPRTYGVTLRKRF
ncbi:MAG: TonB-dependent receptor [Henriciella sp.]|nr:TonB-dependent receptor [Henriciella sp.]MBO6696730.1 TonB-dependent receptor [Henriciella sp.]